MTADESFDPLCGLIRITTPAPIVVIYLLLLSPLWPALFVVPYLLAASPLWHAPMEVSNLLEASPCGTHQQLCWDVFSLLYTRKFLPAQCHHQSQFIFCVSWCSNFTMWPARIVAHYLLEASPLWPPHYLYLLSLTSLKLHINHCGKYQLRSPHLFEASPCVRHQLCWGVLGLLCTRKVLIFLHTFSNIINKLSCSLVFKLSQVTSR